MITPFFICFKIFVQKIGEKEKLQYEENNDQLNNDNSPEFSSDSHVFKTLIIEEENIPENIFHYDPDSVPLPCLQVNQRNRLTLPGPPKIKKTVFSSGKKM
jgi:hypothetical protein